MKGGFFLDIVIRKSSAIFQLLSSKDQTLLVWRDTFLVLNFGLDILDRVARFNFEGDGFTGQSFHEDLHTTSESKDKMKGGFFLDIVIRKGSAIFELFAGEDQSLLVWRDAFLVLNFGLDILNRVAGFNFEGDGFTGQGFHKDLHTATKSKHKMKGGFFLNVVIRKGSAIFELFAGEDQSLLVWRDAFLVLDFGLDILDRVAGFNFEGDGFTGQGFHKDLHTATKSKDKMKGGFFLNVVIRKGSAIFELFAGEDQSLLVWRDAFLVLDFGLDILNRVAGFNFEGDGFTGQGFHKYLHTATKSKDKMKGGFFLNVVIRKGSAIFELFAGEDQTLLVWRDAFLVLDFGFHILDCVARFNFKGDCFAGQSFDENLHSTSESKHKMKGRFLLDIVVGQGSAIFELFTSEDQSLLVGRDAFLVLNFRFHILDCIAWFDFERDGFASQGLHENLHSTSESKDKMKCRLFLNIVVR